ncbi:hypothetical protein ABH922_003574 [Rhodococcus sp. 27YEA15]|uniref:hypothetical protein n=1 Tax=Rhodococcus sp. 27YEA15 TaxID=3156259 RepID=UPI003C7E2373
MPLDLRAILTTLAALASGSLAAFALTNPALRDYAVIASQSEVDRWISSGPTAVAIGAVVAALACVLTQRRGSTRAAWIAVTTAVAVLAMIRVAVPEVAVLDLLIALTIVKSIAAGIILGCALAASWGQATAQNALLLGVLTSFLSVRAFSDGAGRFSTSAIGEPAWGLLAATAAVAVGCAVTASAGFRIRRPDSGEIRIALVVTVALAIGHRVLGAVVDGNQYAAEATIWTVLVLAAGAALALTAIAANRLGDQSGAGGKFLWATTALAASSALLFVDIAQQPGLWPSPWIPVVVAAATVAIGLRIHRRIPTALASAVLVAVPVSELLPFDAAHGVWATTVKVAALGIGGAILLGSLAPGSLVDATLGLAIPFAAMTFASIAYVTRQLSFPIPIYSAYLQQQIDIDAIPVPTDAYVANLVLAAPVDYVTAESVGATVLFAVTVTICAAAIRKRPRPVVEAAIPD